MDDGTQMKPLVVSKRKAKIEIEPHLMSENRQGAHAGASDLFGRLRQDAANQVMVLFITKLCQCP